jgi:glycosyltransferase involved in cell wall biosynthesis
MYRSHSVGVIIPAYNESEFIGDVIRDVPKFVDRLYVVDDCSVDDTAASIRTAAEADARSGAVPGERLVDDELVVETEVLSDRIDECDTVGRTVAVHHETNLGAGGAIKTGYLLALEDDIDVVATIDADGQMDPKKLRTFLEPIVDGEADYTKGDRLSNGEHRREMPRFRLFGNGVLTLLTRIASGYWDVTDPQNGYTVIRVDTLERIDVEGMYEYYGYLNDLLVRLNVADARVVDVALTSVYDDETSHIRYGSYIVNVSQMLLKDFLWRLRVTYPPSEGHPNVPLVVLGAVSAIAGTVQLSRSLSPSRNDSRNVLDALATYLVAAASFLLVLYLDWNAHRNRSG